MNEVTQKMVQSVKWYSAELIRQKVENEYQAGRAIAQKKRPLLAQYQKEYNIDWDNVQKGEAIKSKALWTNRQLFVSALYKNKPVVTFEWRKQGDSEYADTWNKLIKFDFDELEEDQISRNKICDLVDYGIYLAVDEGWDKITESPKKRLYSPLCWIPDPNFDIVKGFNFHGFELNLTESDINGLYQNTDLMLTDRELEELKEKLWEEYSPTLRNWADGLGMWFMYQTIPSPLRTYSVYRHFTKLNNRWYLTEWANERSLLIRCEAIEPVRNEEKKDPRNIPCPVVHSWFTPKNGDPYGVCVWDIARDNQFTEEQVLNLIFNKVNEETFAGITLFNNGYIKGSELAKKTVWKRKYIPVDDLPMNKKLVENIPTQTTPTTDGYNLKNIIDAKSAKEIWFDEQSIWVSTPGSQTATEIQTLQGNQNVRLNTIYKIFLWWEKRYWDILWYRSYQKNFKMNSEKNITLNNGYGSVVYTVMGKDLNMKKDLHLRIVSILEKNEQDELKKSAIMASYNPLMQMANEFGKIQLTREFAVTVWMDKEVVNQVFDYPDEYHKAMSDLELLNNNEEVGEITNMAENHKVFIQIYQQAIDTPAKEKAISARKRALILSGQQAMANAMIQGAWGDMNASTNQLVSNYISQQNQANNQPRVLGTNADVQNGTE